MRLNSKLVRGGSSLAVAVALMQAGSAYAQTTPETAPTGVETGQTRPADVDGAEAPLPDEGQQEGDEIVVTGSRIERAGFDQPTPTTVIGDVELRQGARPNIQQILNDQPQFRATTTPQISPGNTSSGTAPVDLRGLGSARTLTLLNGRRFVGENNLNFVPTGLIERVEVVTGGASAAWGSGAVAGVVNIILDDNLEGLSLGAQSGISSRGDGMRYGFDGTFGTRFADGNGHVMIGAEYIKDKGVLDRNSRPTLGSTAIVPRGTGTELVQDVNFGNQSPGGLITSGIFAGQTFNPDGSLRPFVFGTRIGASPFPAQMIGGEGIGLFDDVVASTPFERLSVYGRASYDLGGATVWVDATYGRAITDYNFVPDFTVAPLTIQATNPFLSSAIRSQLAAAGQSSFTLGRYFNDIFFMRFDAVRENKEAAIGIDGTFGNGFKYSAYYSHGEVDSDQRIGNSRIAANFNRAVNAVSSGGQIVCAVNADAITTNDDPACRPLNPFGQNSASPEAIAYVTGTQQSFSVSKLDSAGVEVQGDLFSLWAGPVTVAVGAEARWEEQSSSLGEQSAAGIFALPIFTAPLEGGFNVKEGFAEIALPLLDIEGAVKLDVNGAARYSDYSTSGGIWSWKLGGTARLFNDLLLRVTRSRDIRSPSVTDLFSPRRINVAALVDRDTAGRLGVIPGYNPTPPQVTTFSGGNPDLVPEVSHTTTIGASFSPSFVRGFNISVDYYDIKIDGAIFTLSASNLTLACSLGSTAACDRIVRDPVTQTVTTAFANAQNIASFQTRGVDIEASYLLPMSRLGDDLSGSLRFRALATYVDRFILDTGLTRTDTAGDVGEGANTLPKWRGTFSVTYQDDRFGLDARLRYVGGGKFNRVLTTLINNEIESRTYVDLGAQFKVDERFTFFTNVNNVFDVDPPISTGNPHYEIMGTYFSAGARVRF
jgi:outer membrane receptor protein involved in Fe transport